MVAQSLWKRYFKASSEAAPVAGGQARIMQFIDRIETVIEQNIDESVMLDEPLH